MVEIESCRILWGLRRLWTLSDLLPLKLKQVEHVHWPSKLKTGQRSIIKLITGSFQQSSCISFSNKSRSGWRFKSRDLDLRIAEDCWGFLRILEDSWDVYGGNGNGWCRCLSAGSWDNGKGPRWVVGGGKFGNAGNSILILLCFDPTRPIFLCKLIHFIGIHLG